MILPNVDTKPTYEAMKRGEWPEPNPEVVAAHEALNRTVSAEAKPATEKPKRSKRRLA